MASVEGTHCPETSIHIVSRSGLKVTNVSIALGDRTMVDGTLSLDTAGAQSDPNVLKPKYNYLTSQKTEAFEMWANDDDLMGVKDFCFKVSK